METYDALQGAIAATQPVVEGVRADQLDRATPCSEWDVHTVLNHVIGSLWLSEGLVSDTAPRHPLSPAGLPETDLAGESAIGPYKEASEAALAATTPVRLAATHQTPFGDMPGAVLMGFTTLDVVVHGWDVAQATGQETSIDDDLVEHVFAFARQVITDDLRGPMIAPAVAVPEPSTPLDRLIAFMGRQP